MAAGSPADLPGARFAPAAADRPCPASGTPHFAYCSGVLHCEAVPLSRLAAQYGTPLHVYSRRAMVDRVAALRAAFGPDALLCYAVKANGNLSLLRLLYQLGTGFDVVSGGELARVAAAGLPTRDVVFAGVAKQAAEIEAAVAAGIRFFNVESPHELPLLAAAGARAGRRVPVALRLNPDVAAGGHAYITTATAANKFGIGLDAAGEFVQRIVREPWLELVGYHVHLGSQLRSAEPYQQALAKVVAFSAAAEERRRGIRYYDLGGGFGIGYGQGAPLDPAAVAARVLPALAERGWQAVVEPGRYLVGDAGVLLTTVLGHKDCGGTRFLLVDAAMNDLLRPALYQAEHAIAPVELRAGAPKVVDVVGPICESGDFLARGRALAPCEPGDRLAVLATGAYGASMGSNYNSRCRPAEVLVDGAAVQVVRRRETFDDLFAAERGLMGG